MQIEKSKVMYYASANATLIACLDRLFLSTPFDKTMKEETSPMQLSVDKVLWKDGGIATVIFVRFNKKRKAVFCYEYGRQNTTFAKE